MLTEICQYLRNWFEREMLIGTFTVTGGVLTKDGTALTLLDGQYFRVIGSVMNDGVHQYGDMSDVLTDEEFDGAVWSMAIPPALLDLAAEIADWVSDNATALNSPYASESFGGYSYSLRTGTTADGAVSGATWQSQFAARLATWRKI